mmetsp:Transcript_45938/g.142195  ORF Transcript_45938/g.142195 Transcript_45938/m.142195 type:complete len:232 (+) Transcript_45938:239-934(+)
MAPPAASAPPPGVLAEAGEVGGGLVPRDLRDQRPQAVLEPGVQLRAEAGRLRRGQPAVLSQQALLRADAPHLREEARPEDAQLAPERVGRGGAALGPLEQPGQDGRDLAHPQACDAIDDPAPEPVSLLGVPPEHVLQQHAVGRRHAPPPVRPRDDLERLHGLDQSPVRERRGRVLRRQPAASSPEDANDLGGHGDGPSDARSLRVGRPHSQGRGLCWRSAARRCRCRLSRH